VHHFDAEAGETHFEKKSSTIIIAPLTDVVESDKNICYGLKVNHKEKLLPLCLEFKIRELTFGKLPLVGLHKEYY
jgi:hypothetical protein